MTTIQIIISVEFVFMIAMVMSENYHKINKASTVMIGAVVMSVTAHLSTDIEVRENALTHLESDIFELVLFLLLAIALVTLMNIHGLFGLIEKGIYSLGWDDRREFLAVMVVTFFASAILDNMTITLVMLSFAPSLFKTENNLHVSAVGTVISANAGGAWSPIGDLTTILLWLQGKITTQEVLREGFLPASTMALVAGTWLYFSIEGTSTSTNEMEVKVTQGEKLVLALCCMSFTLPLLVSRIGQPPYMGLMLGLGLTWGVCGIQEKLLGWRMQAMSVEDIALNLRDEHVGDTHPQTRLERNIEHLLGQTEVPVIFFLTGILLSVGTLEVSGILEIAAHALLGESPTFVRLVVSNVSLGLLSSVVDNVPLTALAIKTIQTTDHRIWVLLALTVGTGGSALSIGSVPGVVAMNRVRGLTFMRFLRIGTRPALAGYAAMVAVWYLQTLVSGV